MSEVVRRPVARLLSKAGTALSRASRAIWLPEGERRLRAWQSPGWRTRQFEYPLQEDAVVLDLGGYEGQWASDLFARYGCTVHVFEPVAEFADGIAKRFAGNPRVHVHPFGLGARTQTLNLSLAADGTSALRGTGPVAEGPIIEALAWLEREIPGELSLVKINIEGGEYDLLEHLIAGGAIARMRFLQVQFHDFVPDASARMRRIQERLEATHVPEWRYEFVWESWARRA